jgi:hypothetical protein
MTSTIAVKLVLRATSIKRVVTIKVVIAVDLE